MNILIVHAHPEPKSFNGALTATAMEFFTNNGHQVKMLDLYAMAFNPISRPAQLNNNKQSRLF